MDAAARRPGMPTFAGHERDAPDAAEPHAPVRQRRRRGRRASWCAVFEAYFDAVDGRPNTKGGALPHRPAADDLPRLLWLGARRDCRTGARPDTRCPRASPRCRAPTATARRRCSSSAAKMDHAAHRRHAAQPEIHPRPAARRRRAWTSWCTWSAPTSAWTATTSSSTWSMPTPCARPSDTPSSYRDLIVRVAGYSDYFCDLGQALQDEIIARTEHTSFGPR